MTVAGVDDFASMREVVDRRTAYRSYPSDQSPSVNRIEFEMGHDLSRAANAQMMTGL